MRIEIDKIASAKALKLLSNGRQLLNKATDISLTRIGTELQHESVNLAPYKMGHLRRSITMKQESKSVKVGSDLVYARIQDQGGTIKARNGKYLCFKVKGRFVRVRQVTIPKYKGRGYLTPAYERQKRGRAKKIFIQEIDKIFK